MQNHYYIGGSLTDDKRSSSPWELPPKALTELDVKLSLHPALIIQS